MTRELKVAVAGILASMSLASAAEKVLLKDPDRSVGLKIEASTVSKGGMADTRSAAGEVKRAMDLTRVRSYQRRFVGDALGGEVIYKVLGDQITTEVGTKRTSRDGPLSGLTAVGRKNGAGNWVFSLEKGSALGEQVAELELLAAFENGSWLPGRVVEVGESWEFVPHYLRASLRRDVKSSQMVGVMKLREIGKAPDGTRQAIIDLVIRGGGTEAKPDGAKVAAEGELAGNLTVNLDVPGRLVFRLNGSLSTGARVGAAESLVKMPLSMTLRLSPL